MAAMEHLPVSSADNTPPEEYSLINIFFSHLAGKLLLITATVAFKKKVNYVFQVGFFCPFLVDILEVVFQGP